MTTQVDLKQLAVQRSVEGPAPIKRKRTWPTRWGVPLAIIAGFFGIVVWSARDRMLPAKAVTVMPVIMSKAEVQEAGTPLFQAAGWIEPRPTAISCSALVEGVVQELLVVEGQRVKAGEPVAKLIDADAKINLQEAEAVYQLREGERDVARATLAAAEQHLKRPVQVEAELADAEATLATLQTEIKNLPFQIKAAEARQTLAEQDLAGKKSVAESIAGRSIQRAQSEFDSAAAALAELKQREPSLLRQQEAWQRKCDALQTKLSLKTEETRVRDEAQANLTVAEARLTQAKLGIDSAKLRLDRMEIRSPIDARVLSLNARPGARLMGINAASERDASTAVTLYNPQMLQVRADVRLEDVPQVQIGQPVQITTAAVREPLVGHVLTMTSLADIQKNTLQVKVAIDNPLDVIRPEMLAQVVFLAPPSPEATTQEKNDPIRLLVARELVETVENTSSVWVTDGARGVARRQSVQLGRAGTDQLVEVVQGLTALDKLIVGGREGLAEGTRIRVTGDDRTLGATPATGAAALKSAQNPTIKEKS